MKKILLVALAAAAMVGCSQNEEIDNAEQKTQVKFGTVVRNSTRAVVTDLDALKAENAGFIVYGYNTKANGVGTTDAKLTDIFLDKKAVTYSTDKWVIGDGTPIYWPGADKVQFFAYAPANALTTNEYSVPADALYPQIAYAVPVAAANQKDLVVASATDKSSSANAVDLLFAHALTQINFTIKGADNLTYIVSKVSLVGIGSEAIYDYKTGWSVPTVPVEYELPIAETTVNGTAETILTASTGSLMLLPQSMSTDTKIKISYVAKNGGTTVYTKNDATIDLNNTAKWEAGKRIRYTLTLSSEVALSFNPDVTDWNKDTETNVPKPDAPQS